MQFAASPLRLKSSVVSLELSPIKIQLSGKYNDFVIRYFPGGKYMYPCDPFKALIAFSMA